MSTYTIQLGTIVAQPTQDRNDLTFDQKLEVGRKHLFDFDYPFFDDRYRDEFERKFIMNFYDREIGYETEFLFKMRLKNWLMINMPYFNQLFESELIKFDPLINSEVKTVHEMETDGTTQSDKAHDDTHTKDIEDEKDTTENIRKQTDKDVKGSDTKDTDRELDTIYDSEGNRKYDSLYDSEGNRKYDSVYDSEGNRILDVLYDSSGNRNYDRIYDSEGNRILDHTYDGNINRTMDGEVDSTTDTQSDSTENTITNESGNRTTEEDRFNRDLKTDTPDTRLSITANRGESGTGYASEIGEKMQDDSITENTNSDSDSDTTTNAQSNEITSGSTHETEDMGEDRVSKDTENTDENATTSDTEDTTEHRKSNDTEDTTENRIVNDTEDTTENRTVNDTEDTAESRTSKDTETTGVRGTHEENIVTDEETDRTQHELRTIGEDGRRDINELINGKSHDLEKFDQHRIGKIGIQTYSRMLTEFRSTFLRIERDCFKEMNQLFMLLY